MASEKLLLCIIIDNSSSMNGEKIFKFKEALKKFHEMIIDNQLKNVLEYSIIGFNNLEAKVFKDFSDINFNFDNIIEGGLALINQAILLGIDTLENKIIDYKQQGCQLYKPWIILLFDGQCYENINKSLLRLQTLITNKKVIYFPFALSDSKYDDNLKNLIKIKRPLIVVDNKYDKLFNWLFVTAYKRIMTPIDKTIKLEKAAFAGWIK